ncbi:MAG: hypothetical protein OEY66_05685 [Gammaproteobacteria bacterium]|nr:hypothetical protein [Gammaproteobacteria bacterium]
MQKIFEFITGLFSDRQIHLTDLDTGYSLAEAIDQVVDGIDTKLRLVPGYRKKLQKEVAGSLEYISQLVDQIPGPINVSRKNFVSDPEVRAYFSTTDTLQNIFSCGNELQTFFDQPENAALDVCCALLCANKEEKKIIGLALEHEVLQRDVVQTAISFSDYKVLSPAIDANGVRSGIKKCIFGGLVTYALQQIANIKIERRDLIHKRRILYAQLRSRQTAGNGLSTMLAQAHLDSEQHANLAVELKEAETRLENITGDRDVFSFYLEEIRKVLAQPEKFIQINTVCFHLNDMGIKLEGEAAQSVNAVCFAELEIVNVMKRVVAVICYNKNDINCGD